MRRTADTLSYATHGLTPDARAALRSMMDVLAGRTRRSWQPAERQADVLFVGGVDADHDAHDARHVVRVTGDGGERGGFTRHLGYPFRVFTVLAVIEEIEQDEDEHAPRHEAAAKASHPSWKLFDSLHRLAQHAARGQWWSVADAHGGQLHVRDDLAEVAADDTVFARIAGGELPTAALQASPEPPPTLPRQDALALLWWTGLHSGRGQLSGTLDTVHAYRLRAWPDFGRLRPGRTGLRLCAMLAANACTRDDLTQALGGGDDAREQACRFLNACAAAGLLRPETRHVAPPPPAPAGNFVGNLVSRLRGRFGFGGARVGDGR